MDNDLDTLATALYVSTDDFLKACPWLAPWRPAVGLAPRITDAELVTVAVLQALLGCAGRLRSWPAGSPGFRSRPVTTSGCANWAGPSRR
jgi:hypothetical protein